MQDEVEDRAINLLVRTSELSLRTIVNAGKKYLEHREHVKTRKATRKPEKPKNGYFHEEESSPSVN